MLGARAMAHVRLGEFEEAADWAVKAAARPNAHAHILAIAAYCLALAGRLDEARAHIAAIRERLPGYSVDDFLTAMQFAPEGAALFREGARRLATVTMHAPRRAQAHHDPRRRRRGLQPPDGGRRGRDAAGAARVPRACSAA